MEWERGEPTVLSSGIYSLQMNPAPLWLSLALPTLTHRPADGGTVSPTVMLSLLTLGQGGSWLVTQWCEAVE